MVGVLEVPITVIAADMAGDKFGVGIDAEAVRVYFQGKVGPGIFGGHGIAVGIQGEAELGEGPNLVYLGDIIGKGRQGVQPEFFLCEKLDRLFPGFAMDTDIGDGIEPLP
jgi:hypothetical protein